MRRLSSVSFRALIAPLCIVLLTCGIITTFLLHESGRQQYDANVLKQEERTDSLAALLDNFFYAYYSISNQIVEVPELRPLNLYRESYIVPQVKAINLLQTLKGIDRQVVDLCVYYHDKDYFITSTAAYTARRFIDCYPTILAQNRQRVYELFKDSRSWVKSKTSIPQFIPLSGVQTSGDTVTSAKSLLLLMPVPARSSNPYGTLGIIVQTDDIIHQLSLAANHGSARILDANGSILFDVGEENLSEGAGGSKNVRTFRTPSSRFPLTYETVIREDALVVASDASLQLTIPLLFIALVACIACFISARWINLPIRRLVAHIDDSDAPLRDDTAIIRQHIHHLNKVAEDNQRNVDELLIRRLISGQMPNEDNLRRCERMLMKDYSHCTVALFQLSAPMESIFPLTVFHYEHAIIHVMQETQMNHLLAIVACDAHDNTIVQHIEKLLKEPIACNVIITAVGTVKEDLQQLHTSYISAVDLLKEMQYQGRTGVELSHEHDELRNAYPIEAMHNLHYALRAQDAELLVATCADVIRFLQDEHTTPEVGTIVAYDLSVLFPELAAYAADSVSVFCHKLKACITEQAAAFAKPISQPSHEDTENWKACVESDIQELLETPGFGISLLAQKYVTSDSAFSHMFKRTFGVNFISYVNQMKIQRAKTYLATTTMNLEAIAVQLGYSSSSNFTRMFKSYEGITPSAYRQVAQNNRE